MDVVAGQVVLPVFSDDVVDVDDQLGGDMVIVVLVAIKILQITEVDNFLPSMLMSGKRMNLLF